MYHLLPVSGIRKVLNSFRRETNVIIFKYLNCWKKTYRYSWCSYVLFATVLVRDGKLFICKTYNEKWLSRYEISISLYCCVERAACLRIVKIPLSTSLSAFRLFFPPPGKYVLCYFHVHSRQRVIKYFSSRWIICASIIREKTIDSPCSRTGRKITIFQVFW